MADREVINRETDARFWAQTGYKPGQKLDPSNPSDKAMAPVWMDIFKKVQREADAGKLVTTYDHPEVAQHLSDAAVANRAAAAHVDAAAASPEAKTAQENVVAATTAQGISTQKAREAAAKQPPTVDPKIVKSAGQEVAKTPPPPQAPASEHIAHEHAREQAYDHARAVHAEAPAREALYKEANVRFWNRTHYKPGQKLDMSVEQDRRMAKVWMDIFRQVQREAEAGALTFTRPESVPPVPPPMPPPMAPPPPGVMRPPVAPPMMPPMMPPMTPPVARPPMMPPMTPPVARPPMQRPPMEPPRQRPPMMPGGFPSAGPAMGPQGGPQTGPSMGPPTGPSMGPPGAQAPAPPTPTPEAPGGVPSGPPGEGAPETPEAPPEEKPGIGKYLVFGAAVLVGGGLLYYATTRDVPRKMPARARSRSSRPSVPSPARSPARVPLLSAAELDE